VANLTDEELEALLSPAWISPLTDLSQRAGSELLDLRKRVADLEESQRDYDALFDMQHKRTHKADVEWQTATGHADVLPDLGELIEWLRSDRDSLRRMVADLAGALETVRSDVEESSGCNHPSDEGDDADVYECDGEDCLKCYVLRTLDAALTPRVREIVKEVEKEKHE
jgi:hypothetical protein